MASNKNVLATMKLMMAQDEGKKELTKKGKRAQGFARLRPDTSPAEEKMEMGK